MNFDLGLLYRDKNKALVEVDTGLCPRYWRKSAYFKISVLGSGKCVISNQTKIWIDLGAVQHPFTLVGVALFHRAFGSDIEEQVNDMLYPKMIIPLENELKLDTTISPTTVEFEEGGLKIVITPESDKLKVKDFKPSKVPANV